MQLAEKIHTMVEDELKGSSYFVVDVLGSSENKKIQVLLDGDTGVSIDVCSKISRKVTHNLEEEGIEKGDIALEVSSPGVSRPLKLKRQYHQHIGRKLEIDLVESKNIIGILEKIEENGIEISIMKNKKKQIESITFDNIKEAKVLVSFN